MHIEQTNGRRADETIAHFLLPMRIMVVVLRIGLVRPTSGSYYLAIILLLYGRCLLRDSSGFRADPDTPDRHGLAFFERPEAYFEFLVFTSTLWFEFYCICLVLRFLVVDVLVLKFCWSNGLDDFVVMCWYPIGFYRFIPYKIAAGRHSGLSYTAYGSGLKIF